MEERCS
jgi:hypothetical protein